MISAEAYFDGSSPANLADLLRLRATRNSNRPAVTFIDDGGVSQTLTYDQLLEKSQAVADALQRIGPPGCRALLLYPAGHELLIAFFGCAIAGWIPVPTCYPKPARPIPRLDSIAKTCSPALLLSDAATLEAANRDRWCRESAAVPALATELLLTDSSEVMLRALSAKPLANIDKDLRPDLALLQFTSGSTSEPKGVMVTHQNMLANLEAIRIGFGLQFSDNVHKHDLTGVFWLPAFHDMGLIGGLLAPLYAGAHSVIMSPSSFLRRPLSWLQAISDHKAVVTGAPNFAYQLCVERVDGSHADGLDLSPLKVAFCGAEPIQARTLEQFASRFAHTGFSKASLFPCYGLAESTLYVAGGHFDGQGSVLSVDRADLAKGIVRPIDARKAHSDTVSRIVSCGKPAFDSEVTIVDPVTKKGLAEQLIGQIWIRGNSVASGYWGDSEKAKSEDCTELPISISSAFQNRLADQPVDSPPYLHTGDLGFMHEGELYVTGRSKDVIILRGRNHYPQDIEYSVYGAVGDYLDQIVAVSCRVPSGEALAVVAELQRSTSEQHWPEVIRQIRRIVIEQHEVDPRRIVLVRTASIPRTTSGKVQRSEVKRLLEENGLAEKRSWDRTDVRADGAPLPFPELSHYTVPVAGQQVEQLAEAIQVWMLSWLMVRGGVDEHELCPDRSLDQLGLDSLSAVELSGEIEDWLGLQLTPMVAFEYPTPRKLSTYLASHWAETQNAKSN